VRAGRRAAGAYTYRVRRRGAGERSRGGFGGPVRLRGGRLLEKLTRVFFPHPFLFCLSLAAHDAAQRFRICPARVPSLISNDWWSGVPSECSLTAMVNA